MSINTIGSSPATLNYQPEIIFLEEGVQQYPLAREILSRLPEVPRQEFRDISILMEQMKSSQYDVFGKEKKRLALSHFKGSFLKKCPGISPGMVCCNYYVVNLSKNCIYDCSYCFLQDFLGNNPMQMAYVNVEDLIGELEEVFTQYPDRNFRVGTGELTDSLALDAIVPYTSYLLPFFNQQSNAMLELKTKSDQISNLLNHPDPTNIIVSWSLNPQGIIDLEEKGTPSLVQRLESARACLEKGYRIGFHFDPIILMPGWEEAYQQLVNTVCDTVPINKVEWVSLGSFRYRPNLKSIIKNRHPETRLFTSEHQPSKDGKFRYLRPLRNRAYETIRGYLKSRSQELNIYLCMETKEIWEGVTGKTPRSDKKLDQFFDL
ncbi:MAG: radical SAM protein [Nitrospina sp.]|jgi:spore photoproduct lyase|nr:radical SAM protein [Nitrospina sp.]MBT3508437.1 radical SAM protein [Nitrospina sp.]MBT3876987.1 radical SAM protein [Nitrospina sp.]MBT4048818.1 radical SAM protein [Nitrospina sp.]MBT4556129.1 radical SAM protein [Nitrospina sp.]